MYRKGSKKRQDLTKRSVKKRQQNRHNNQENTSVSHLQLAANQFLSFLEDDPKDDKQDTSDYAQRRGNLLRSA